MAFTLEFLVKYSLQFVFALISVSVFFSRGEEEGGRRYSSREEEEGGRAKGRRRSLAASSIYLHG